MDTERLQISLHTAAWTMWLLFLRNEHVELLAGYGRKHYLDASTKDLERWVQGDRDPPSDYCTCYEMICDYAEVLPELQTQKTLAYMVQKLHEYGSDEAYAREIQDLLQKHDLADTIGNRVKAQRVWAARVTYNYYNDIITQLMSRSTSTESRRRFMESITMLMSFFDHVLEEIEREPSMSMPMLPDAPQAQQEGRGGADTPPRLPIAPASDTNGVLVGWPQNNDSAAAALPDAYQRTLVKRISVRDNLTHQIADAKRQAERALEVERKKRKKHPLRFDSISLRKKNRNKKKARDVVQDRSLSSGGIQPATAATAGLTTYTSTRGGTLSVRYQVQQQSSSSSSPSSLNKSNNGAGGGAIRSRSVSSVPTRGSSSAHKSNGLWANDDDDDDDDDDEDDKNASGVNEEYDRTDESTDSQSGSGGGGGGGEDGSSSPASPTSPLPPTIHRFALHDFVVKCWSYLNEHGCRTGMADFLSTYRFPRETLMKSYESRADDAIQVISSGLALSAESFIYEAIRKQCAKTDAEFDDDVAAVRNHFLDRLNSTWLEEADTMCARLVTYRKCSEALRDRIASLEGYFFMAFDAISTNNQLKHLNVARDLLNRAFDATARDLEATVSHHTPAARLAGVGSAAAAVACSPDPVFKKVQANALQSANRRRNRSCVTVGRRQHQPVHANSPLGAAFAEDD